MARDQDMSALPVKISTEKRDIPATRTHNHTKALQRLAGLIEQNMAKLLGWGFVNGIRAAKVISEAGIYPSALALASAMQSFRPASSKSFGGYGGGVNSTPRSTSKASGKGKGAKKE
ncbi:hypothetical protein BGW38_008233 [Lunasporangiospora selenospora]|uniref:Uncharacterized protein n=1 Tax=Lunasporangiospora selenospora TaxID=979761 RepID=A0A9P6FY44_9FUNG|nr:hypothetical protein BGW38_008233 [Lunasporangiospora selenospora]